MGTVEYLPGAGNPDQIIANIRALENAMVHLTPSVFKPPWAHWDFAGGRLLEPTAIFDPHISPARYELAHRVHRHFKSKIADDRAVFRYPLGWGEKWDTSDNTEATYVAFAADQLMGRPPIYVLLQGPQADESSDEDWDLAGTPEYSVTGGAVNLRFSDLLLNSRYRDLSRGASDCSAEDPMYTSGSAQTPMAELIDRFRYGTTPTNKCSFMLNDRCGVSNAQTLLLPYFMGSWLLMFEVCKTCYGPIYDDIYQQTQRLQAEALRVGQALALEKFGRM